MNSIETIQDFYKRKFDSMPDNIFNEIGHFNLFRLEPYVDGKPTNIPYQRRDFYKIMLVKGSSQVHFADQVVDVKKQALSFSNPQIPYKWEHLDKIREGIYCIFNQHFFHQFGQLKQYEVFQSNGTHIFELSDEEMNYVREVFERMVREFNTDYKYKYDIIRNQIFELLHFALKMQPSKNLNHKAHTASQRISTMFLELLERQFPIDDLHPTVQLRSASDFANQLNVHVNHLNRAVKESTQKTTTQLISERVLQESKILLRHSHWNVSEIADALGFTEITHFDNFFKKYVKASPLKFRKDLFNV
ncbi:MAG: helix-turn-helix transcriptional regulator [Bacteroidetes bacterium]|nr:helix-turn-helix transcriptional regulator [Bacteroidota bacterium]